MILRDILHYLRNPYGIGEEKMRETRLAAADLIEKPIDMILHCPKCFLQHIDCPDPVTEGHPEGPRESCAGTWTNPPHRSHLCHRCRFVWRPADVPTNGVAKIQTRGANDTPRFDVD